MTACTPLFSSTSAQPPGSDGRGESAIIDADFLVLDPLHTYAKSVRPGTAGPMPALAAGMGALKSKASPVQFFTRRGGWGFWLGGISLVAGAFWTSGGYALFLSDNADHPPMPPLTLALLTSGTEDVGGRSVLHVEAEARNGSERARALPPLSILVTTGKGAAMRYNVQPPPDGIGPNGRQRFSTRLPVPADGVSAVRIAFAQ